MAGLGQPAVLRNALRTNALALEFVFSIKYLLHRNQV